MSWLNNSYLNISGLSSKNENSRNNIVRGAVRLSVALLWEYSIEGRVILLRSFCSIARIALEKASVQSTEPLSRVSKQLPHCNPSCIHPFVLRVKPVWFHSRAYLA